MKVICINGSEFLEKHKIYKVVNMVVNSYCLEYKGWFHKMNFETVEDNRDRKIERILEKDKTRE